MQKSRKLLGGLLSLSMGATAFGSSSIVLAEESREGSAFETSITSSAITIGNDLISRSFSIDNRKVSTSGVTNKKINRTLSPGQGSENFVISAQTFSDAANADDLIANPQTPDYEAAGALARSGWQVSLTNGSGGGFTSSDAGKLIDGDLNTHPDDYKHASNPWDLVINLGEVKTVSAFSVDKRPGYSDAAYGINGTMAGFKLYTSENGTDWTQFDEGAFTAEDYNLHEAGGLSNVGDRVYFNFTAPQTTQYIKIQQTSTVWNTNKQEFSSSEINLYENKIAPTVVTPKQALDRSAWTGSIEAANNGPFTQASFNSIKDGDLSTYPDEGGAGQGNHNGFPINVTIDLGSEQNIQSFSLDKRPGASNSQDGVNGTVGAYEVFVSNDNSNWTSIGGGAFTAEAYNLHTTNENGTTLYNVGDRVYANLHTAVSTRYIRLQFTGRALGSADEFAMSEVNLYSDAYQGPEYRILTSGSVGAEGTISTSDLTYKSAESTDTENGVKLTISYEPFNFGGTTFNIDEIYVAEDGKDYMRSFLEIKPDKESAIIRYIDQDAFVIPEGDRSTIWSHPTNAGGFGYGGLNAHDALLGQPIYVDGLFMGSEFPAAETEYNTSSNTTQVRYYSGKTFTQMEEDNLLTTDGKFVSWQNVIGAGRGTTVNEVKTDFFNYIEEIATPTVFRKQYNSWYDNMKRITDESIEKSFVGVEDALARNGVEPLDAYVVDDGWNSYADTESEFNAETGNNLNRTGFWEINDKFPNDFYTSTSLANKLQSTFGIWIGPRGGYGTEGMISSIIQNNGTGYSVGSEICIASHKYIDNYKRLAKMWQTDYGVEYWKWDGFSDTHCTNTSHDHMIGGPNNMYYTSDLWEHWIDLFEEVRAHNAAQGRPLFINATCFVELSPWMLQWVNTIWLQASGDTGETSGNAARHLRKIYYRDNVYHTLTNTFQVQFPQNHFYNHEPIYGVSDGSGSNATDADFRQYMFANAMRGTAFWELYYSPSIVNEEKYEITMDVLDWMESNQDVLKTSRLHGGRPANNEPYGFSAWKDQEGIVSFVNPTSQEVTYTLALDGQAGVDPSVRNLSYISVRPFVCGTSTQTYSYGDSITVTIPANEMLIYHFGAKETSTPSVVSAKNTSNNKLAIKFDQRITPQSVKVNGKAVSGFSLHDDYRTIDVPALFGSQTLLNVELSVKDAAGQDSTVTVDVPVYRNGYILDTSIDGVVPDSLEKNYDADLDSFFTSPSAKTPLNSTNSLAGSHDFSIVLDVKTTDSNKALFNSGDDVALSVNEEGYVLFKVGDHILSSKDVRTYVDEKDHGTFGTDAYVPHVIHTVDEGKINDGSAHRITASKAANGMLKIYIDGKLYSSHYSKDLIGLSLTGGNYTMADAGFTGQIGNILISNAAKPINEIEDEAPLEDDELSSMTYSRTGWTAEACSGANADNGDSGASAAIDDNTSNRWHTIYNSSCHSDHGHWIKVNFAEPEDVTAIVYKGRGNNNGSIKDYKLELLDADDNVIKTVTGTFTSSTGLQKVDVSNDGVPVSAAGFRLTEISTINGRNFAAAEELYAEGPNPVLSGEPLEQLKDGLYDAMIEHLGVPSLEDLDLTSMTTDTAEACRAVLNKLNSTSSIRKSAWNALYQQAISAVDALVDASAVIEALDTTKATYDGPKKGTDEEWAVFQDAYETAEAARTSGTAQEVQSAAADLLAAWNALSNVDPEPALNYTLLNQAIAHAERISSSLDAYKDGSAKDNFIRSLSSAQALVNKAQDQAQINAAASRLCRDDLNLRLTPDASALNSLTE